MARATRVIYEVLLENGATLTAVTDQRDWAAAEAQQFPAGASTLTFARYMVWNAARRAGAYTGTWPMFNETDAVLIDDVTPNVDSEDEQRLDPGQRTPNGTGVSTSRSSRANH